MMVISSSSKKQPLEIAVSMSFKQALPGFGSMLTTDIATINDVNIPVVNEDVVDGKQVPGITTLGSIIESLRPVEPVAEAYPITLESIMPKASDEPPSKVESTLFSSPRISMDDFLRRAIEDVGVTIPESIDMLISSTV